MKLHMKSLRIALPVAAMLAGSGCGDDAATCDVTVPTTWDDTDFEANAAAELALRAQLQGLVSRMAEGEHETPNAITVATLNADFEAGDPSLRDAMTTTYATVVEDLFDLFIPTVGVTLDPAISWNPSPSSTDVGGRMCGPEPTTTTGCWNFSAGGVDMRQLVDKGSYQAVLYHQATLRTSGEVTAATVDQIAALFGANAMLDVDGANMHVSKYAKSMGYYARIRGHLIAAKAYVSAGASCEAELHDELNATLADWEASQVGRFVYYANAGLELFASGTATAGQNAEALHDIAEGLGLVFGMKGLPDSARTITDAEIDQIMTSMKVPTLDGATMYELLRGEAQDLDAIQAAFDLIQSIYGFTDDEMLAIKTPTAG